MGKRVFLTGGTGFIGGHILRRLVERGHQVTCLARKGSADKLKSLELPGVDVLVGEFNSSADWTNRLSGHDVVVNSVGIIRETRSATFDDVHAKAPIAMFRAAKEQGVGKAIQISGLGADDAAESRYHLSKRDGDRALAELELRSVILRPSFVYGPNDHSMTFFRSLAALPLTPVAGDGRYAVQPVIIDDLARAVCDAVERDELVNVAADMGGAEQITFDELLDVLAQRQGKPAARKLHFPWWWMRLVSKVTDAIGSGPINSDELGMLRRGNTTDNRDFVDSFGFTPRAFRTGIAQLPLSQADLWRARLVHWRTPLRLMVAFIWIATGFISAFVSAEQGFELLATIGVTGALASGALYGTSLLELAIGGATAVGWKVKWMGGIQLLLMLGFTAILTWGMPELWLHPFGPLTKNIPIVGATVTMMALED